MSESSRFEQLFDLVRATVSLPRELWRAHLEDLCPDDPELVEEALAELEGGQALTDWQGPKSVAATAEMTFGALSAPKLSPPRPELETLREILKRPFDTQRYKDLGLVGRGSIGSVYRVQDTLLENELAMKRAHFGPLPENLEQVSSRVLRFVREAQVTSTLEHPAVVSIHDIALCRETGEAYFTMDLVRGVTIQSAVEQRELPRAVLLEALIDAAQALEHAHSLGVVHADISAANLLVTASGSGYLMDWEMARRSVRTNATEPSNETSPPPSNSGQGTTWFLSPQRAADTRRAPDVADDIYALGAVLYLVLTTRGPFSDLVGPRATTLAVHAHVASGRSPTPIAPDQAPRELAAICAKAMAAEPKRRYSTAGALIQDLRAYIALEPVSAYKGGPIHRSALFVRRKPRWALGVLCALVACVLAATLVASSLKFQKARVSSEMRRANASQTFLLDMFKQANPTASAELDPKASSLVKLAIESLEGLRGQPELHAHTSSLLARICDTLGQNDEGLVLAQEALTWAQVHYSVRDPRLAPFLISLANTQVGAVDELERAATYTQAAGLFMEADPPNWVEVIGARSASATIRRSEQELRDIVADAVEHLGPKHPQTADARLSLIQHLGDHTAKTDEAVGILEALVADHQNGTGFPLYQQLLTRYHLAMYYGGERAIEMLQADRAIAADAFGELNTIVMTYDVKLSNLYTAVGRVDEAIAMQHAILDFAREYESPQNVSIALNNLGQGLVASQQYAESRGLLDEAFELAREHFTAGTPHIGYVLCNRAACLQALNEPALAEQDLRLAIAEFDISTEPVASNCLRSRWKLADMLRDQERFDEALDLIEVTIARLAAVDQPDVEDLARSQESLARLYAAWGKGQLAAVAREKAADIRKGQ